MKFLSDSKLTQLKLCTDKVHSHLFSTIDILISHPSLSILPAICKSDCSIFQHLRVSRHLDSTVVNYFEQMYAPFVVLRFSLDRTLANCLWPFMYHISKKKKKRDDRWYKKYRASPYCNSTRNLWQLYYNKQLLEEQETMPIDIRSRIVFEKHYALACKRWDWKLLWLAICLRR